MGQEQAPGQQKVAARTCPTGGRPYAVEAKALRATGLSSGVALALGAMSVGALAIGAVAIARLAIGRVGIGRARIGRLEIGELVVERVGDQRSRRDG